MHFLVISGSLSPQSRSYQLARAAVGFFEQEKQDVTLIDLRRIDLPLCNGEPSQQKLPEVKKLQGQIQKAAAILIAAPVYNYGMNAAVKNLIDLTGTVWNEKLVGMLIAAGGRAGYMAPFGLLNSLMINFRCFVIPRFVYATEEAVTPQKIILPEITRRIRALVLQTIDLAQRLSD